LKASNISKRSSYIKNVVFKGNLSDKKTVARMNGLINDAFYKHEKVLTDFLDPGERDILKKLAGNEVCLQSFGGYSNAEKKRVFIAEDWDTISPVLYQISLFEIEYPQKFFSLTHSDVLGSLANAGIETSTFGDIITDGNGRWQFLGKSELTDFFQYEITHIGHTKVKIRPIASKKILVVDDESKHLTVVASSLRLDAVLAAISKQSRNNIKDNITNNLVKLNWHSIKDSNIIIGEDDVLSLRHFGRCKIVTISRTKKGNYKVVYKLWQTKRKKRKS